MLLDAATQRNLELTHNLKDNSIDGTLLWILDETLTSIGGRFLRFLRTSLTKPLIDTQEIKNRHNAVEYLVEDFELLEELRNLLRKIQDLERLSSKLASRTANARDMIAIKNSVIYLPRIKKPLPVPKIHI